MNHPPIFPGWNSDFRGKCRMSRLDPFFFSPPFSGANINFHVEHLTYGTHARDPRSGHVACSDWLDSITLPPAY